MSKPGAKTVANVLSRAAAAGPDLSGLAERCTVELSHGMLAALKEMHESGRYGSCFQATVEEVLRLGLRAEELKRRL